MVQHGQEVVDVAVQGDRTVPEFGQAVAALVVEQQAMGLREAGRDPVPDAEIGPERVREGQHGEFGVADQLGMDHGVAALDEDHGPIVPMSNDPGGSSGRPT